MRRHVSVVCGLLWAGCAWAQADPVAWELGGLRGRLIGPVTEDVAKNGEGSTVRLKDGTLYHAFSRHIRDVKITNPDLWPAVIAKTVSRDGGVTWSAPEVLFRSTTGHNAMQASLARLANGDIGITYSRIDSVSAATKVFRYSSDEGKTWSAETVISPTGAYWTSAHDRMVVLSTGRILHPLHHKVEVSPERIGTRVAYSDDHGRTWKLAPRFLVMKEVIPGSAADKAKRYGFWEASIAERADGSLIMIGRTYTGWLCYTISTDRGLTWSELKMTELMSGAAPGRIERVPGSGDLLVVWNSCCLDPVNFMLGPRVTLSAAVSQDGGMTWKWRREIESITNSRGPGVEYPAINIWGGKVYVTYRAQAGFDRATSKMQEYLAVLPLPWFYEERDNHHPEAAMRRTLAGADGSAFPMGGVRGVPVGVADAVKWFYSEGSTIRLQDGSLLHAMNERSAPPPGEAYHPHYVPTVIAAVSSQDGGRTWTAPRQLLSSPTRTASHPSLARLPDGSLGITYNRIAGEMAATKVFRSSRDEGRTWSEETLISPADGYWTSAHDRMLVHSSGRIVHPLHVKEVLLPEQMATYVAWSDDNGRTWHRGKDRLIVERIVPGFVNKNHGAGYWEVSIAERADGSLFMAGRTRAGRLYWSESRDRGETWAQPAPLPQVSSEAPVVVVRVPESPDLLLVWNSCCLDPKNNLLGRRLTLSAAISGDGGKTWKGQREIASVAPHPGGGDGISYPSVYIDGGVAYVGYYARGSRGTQYMAALPLAWFYVHLKEHHEQRTN